MSKTPLTDAQVDELFERFFLSEERIQKRIVIGILEQMNAVSCEFEDFEENVWRMREKQKEFFNTRDFSLLKECKKLERQVDAHFELPAPKTLVNP